MFKRYVKKLCKRVFNYKHTVNGLMDVKIVKARKPGNFQTETRTIIVHKSVHSIISLFSSKIYISLNVIISDDE